MFHVVIQNIKPLILLSLQESKENLVRRVIETALLQAARNNHKNASSCVSLASWESVAGRAGGGVGGLNLRVHRG